MTPLSLDATEESFSSLARRLSHMVDEMVGGQYVRFSRAEGFRPPLNAYETASHYVICMELAGMPRDQIDVQAEPGRIVIRGRRGDPHPPRPHEHDPLCVHVMEIDTGSFYREVKLPGPVDVDGIRATYREGFLWVHIPKQTP